jgi:hypothetical protein
MFAVDRWTSAMAEAHEVPHPLVVLGRCRGERLSRRASFAVITGASLLLWGAIWGLLQAF